MDSHYDVLLVGSGPSMCDCKANMWPGEVVFIDPVAGKNCGQVRCLACAAAKSAPPVPVDLVAKSAAWTRDYFCRAMAGALAGNPLHPTYYDIEGGGPPAPPPERDVASPERRG